MTAVSRVELAGKIVHQIQGTFWDVYEESIILYKHKANTIRQKRDIKKVHLEYEAPTSTLRPQTPLVGSYWVCCFCSMKLPHEFHHSQNCCVSVAH